VLLQSVRSELQAILHGISAEITVGADGLAGRSNARAELASTLGGRIIFAGEATSRAHYGFAHGANLEGKAAAERVIAMLNA